ncbi:hypothetical protein KUF54_02120 [Comamonas sp. Y33R10-2]|uniref:hypothetical protein n=1 Tax=Comamonas sp. Y33R10-2 TaxID=2853257 RepID=UPI001C5C9E2A|nr:hypothetical protein [Comamonas sp. Y33R10-2]QXZ10084.1 hypothetical protein KUF54_02120 [Comamonas sp. Y33R10-2]
MSARYHAPAVAYAFARPAWAGWALLVIWLALLTAMLAWKFQSQVGWLRVFLAFAVLLLATELLRRQWQYWPQGKLLWNGEHWSIESETSPVAESQAVQLRIGLDGGSWLWVCVSDVLLLKSIDGKRKVLWIFITQQHSPVQWGDLRRAVYSFIAPLKEQG